MENLGAKTYDPKVIVVVENNRYGQSDPAGPRGIVFC